MSSGHFETSPSPQCPHYNQPGIIVPPPSTASLAVTGSNPVLSNSPCPECALHSTILHSMAFNMNSMDAACHHLHASASCSSCYSNFQLQQQRLGFDNGHHHCHHQHTHPGTRQYQCGHVQQPYPSDPYYQQSDTIQPQASTSYSTYPYQDWTQTSSRTGYPNSHNPQQPCYDISSPGPIIPLPSPTISIPSINPYLTSLETPAKNFELPPVSEITGSAMTSQNTFTTDNNLEVTYQSNPVPTDTAQTYSPYTKYNENNANPLTAISSMKISDDSQELKSETRNGRIESQRRKAKPTTEKRKSKSEKLTSEVRKRQPEDVCQVCGDRASGYHYNALTCEGCKGFFRRSITNKTTYKQGCKQGGNCEMDTYTRRKCPFCRLKKCREVGMLEECLLTEIQCQSKRRRRRAKQDQQPEEANKEESTQSENQASPDLSSIASSPCESDSSRNEDANSISLTLTDEERSLVDTVSEAFKRYNINPEIVRRWEKYINKESNKTCKLSDITTVHVQVLVEYTKSLPGFISLDPEDQIALLKGSVMEAILIRNSCGYNHLTREINIPAILEETGAAVSQIKALSDFFAVVGRLHMDKIEYALLIAIVIFNSDYPYVKNKAAVEEYQDQYLSTLAKYSISREPHRPFIFARILAILTEIRTLGHYNAELVSSWKKRDTLTPLLCEIWDLD